MNMKFCTRIINKIGEYKNVEVGDLDAKLKTWIDLLKILMFLIFMKFSTQNKWLKGWYTYEVNENCSILKTPYPLTLLQLRPKFFHPLDLWRPISNESPSLQMISNQLKENPRMAIKCYQVFLLGWLSFSVSSTH